MMSQSSSLGTTQQWLPRLFRVYKLISYKILTHEYDLITRGEFNKFTDFFVQVFKIVALILSADFQRWL